VVGPGGVGDVHALVTLHIAQEITNKTERTRTRKSLANGNTVFLDGRTVGSIDELRSETVEIRETLNRRILVIALASNTSFSLSNARKNDGLAVIITVGTHTKGNLARILISLELLIQSKNSIWRSLSNLQDKISSIYPTVAQREAKERTRVGFKAFTVSTCKMKRRRRSTSKHGTDLKEKIV
jgi:hypothetical protein